MRKVFIFLLIAALFVAGFFYLQGFFESGASKNGVGEIVERWRLQFEKPKITKLLFVGDIMLDRGVEYQIQKNKNDFYPFVKISDFLKQFDLVFANLEGPIVAMPADFPDESLKFAFASTTSISLAKANFNVVSLANNHTLNMKQQGLTETKDFLNKANIDFVGDPAYCLDTPIYQKDGIAILGFNITFPFNCSVEEIANVVKAFRASSTDFLIVTMHWGEEYQPANSQIQQNFAHQIIDEGCDLIIGSHPHVVQNIEEYNGKLIFYSLGNFIFDQYFSNEVQQGLAVEIILLDNKKPEFKLYPIFVGKAQPYLMPQEESQVFLDNLAQRSSPQLSNGIKGGIIEKYN